MSIPHEIVLLSSLVYTLAACETTHGADLQATSRACLAEVNKSISVPLSPPHPPHETPGLLGDFDGNGEEDTLCIGLRPGSNTGWLFVQLKDLDRSNRIVSLEHFSPDTPVSDIRVFREPANIFTTRCGAMPDECGPDDPLQLDLHHDSIFLVVLDASGILIYWDKNTGTFKREWLID